MSIRGLSSVLHTWGQTLVFHPHVHCVVPGGGFSFDGRRWVRVPTGTFLLAVKVLSRRFRTLVKNAITEAYDDGSLEIPPHIAPDRTALDLLLAALRRPTGTATSSLPSADRSKSWPIWPRTPTESRSRTSASPPSTASTSPSSIATTTTAMPGSRSSSRPSNSSAASSCTSSRRASLASATTASSPIATARPTSIRRAPSSPPRALSRRARLLPIPASVLNAAKARCARAQRSTLSVPEHGSTPHEHGLRDPPRTSRSSPCPAAASYARSDTRQKSRDLSLMPCRRIAFSPYPATLGLDCALFASAVFTLPTPR